MTTPTLDHARLSLRSLRRAGAESPLGDSARLWICSMTVEQDGEDGPQFWRWILDAQNAEDPLGLRDSYFLVDDRSGEVLATASLVADDRGMGKLHAIPGLWLGGVNVRRQYRGMGLGARIVALIDEEIAKCAGTHGGCRVNLFTSNPIAKLIYERLGYRRIEGIAPRDKARQFYHKIFGESKGATAAAPTKRKKADVLKFIEDLNTRSLSYHNHKEASAWGGLAFYYLVIFGWIVPLSIKESLFAQPVVKIVAVLGVIAVTWFVHLYCKTQMNLRRTFGNFTGACYRLSSRCIGATDEEIDGLDFSVPAPEAPVGDTRSFAIPSFVMQEVAIVSARPHGERQTLESSMNTLIVIALAMALAAIVLSRPTPSQAGGDALESVRPAASAPGPAAPAQTP